MAVAHRIYATALFDAAQDHGALEEVREELAAFAASLREVPELGAVLSNPELDPRAKAAIVRDLLDEAHELVRNFLLLVVEKGRAGEIEVIAREFEALCRAAEGVLEVEVTTAYELSEDERRAILEEIERASGRRIEARVKVNPALVGGIVLQAGSLRLDASVRGRLDRLRRELTTGSLATS